MAVKLPKDAAQAESEGPATSQGAASQGGPLGWGPRMQQCCTLCTLPRCQAGKGGAAATSGHPALGPGRGRGAVVGPLPRSGSRTNPHRKGGLA